MYLFRVSRYGFFTNPGRCECCLQYVNDLDYFTYCMSCPQNRNTLKRFLPALFNLNEWECYCQVKCVALVSHINILFCHLCALRWQQQRNGREKEDNGVGSQYYPDLKSWEQIVHSRKNPSVVRTGLDPGFPAGGGANRRGGHQYTICQFFRNCMKLRKFRAVGECAPGAAPRCSTITWWPLLMCSLSFFLRAKA